MMTIGSARPMEDAARIAYRELVRWIAPELGVGEDEAYLLLTHVRQGPPRQHGRPEIHARRLDREEVSRLTEARDGFGPRWIADGDKVWGRLPSTRWTNTGSPSRAGKSDSWRPSTCFSPTLLQRYRIAPPTVGGSGRVRQCPPSLATGVLIFPGAWRARTGAVAAATSYGGPRSATLSASKQLAVALRLLALPSSPAATSGRYNPNSDPAAAQNASQDPGRPL